MRVILAVLTFVLANLANSAVAAPAPDIVGKSVVVTWTENRQLQRADGSVNVASSNDLRIYISSAGRPFVRGSSAVGRFSASSEQVGGSGTTNSGGMRVVSIDGHTIVLQAIIYGNWGRNLRVEIAPGGSSCSAQMLVAKESGSAPKAFRSAMSGMQTEVHAVTVSGVSCTVQQGNVFAN